jgi:hypothetical protein
VLVVVVSSVLKDTELLSIDERATMLPLVDFVPTCLLLAVDISMLLALLMVPIVGPNLSATVGSRRHDGKRRTHAVCLGSDGHMLKEIKEAAVQGRTTATVKVISKEHEGPKQR